MTSSLSVGTSALLRLGARPAGSRRRVGDGSAALIELELAGRVTLEDGVYRAAI